MVLQKAGRLHVNNTSVRFYFFSSEVNCQFFLSRNEDALFFYFALRGGGVERFKNMYDVIDEGASFFFFFGRGGTEDWEIRRRRVIRYEHTGTYTDILRSTGLGRKCSRDSR